MARPTNITLCSFCGKSHAEVKKLIAGPGVYICDNCITLCKSVLDKELSAETKRNTPIFLVPKPWLCSFCGNAHANVKELIAGPGANICDNCVNLCESVLDMKLSARAKWIAPGSR